MHNMIGALAGDIIGRPYEMINWKSKQFPLFNDKCRPTDDSILTIAIADAFMNNKDIHTTLQDYYHWYPVAGYGMGFKLWAMDRHTEQLESSGNGAAMRVSPVAYLSDDPDEVAEFVKKSIAPSHNSPEAFRGANAIAQCILAARKTNFMVDILEVAKQFYEMDFDYEDLMENYTEGNDWGYNCDRSVPQAIYCFLISKDFEDCIRTAVSIGGDTDTIADMAGAIAEAFYGGVPKDILDKTIGYFRDDERLFTVIKDFQKYTKYAYEI